MGLTVAATTRKLERAALLHERGADHVVIDDGAMAEKVRAIFPEGADRVLELVGARTLLDSLKAAAPRGIVCMTGILGGAWMLEHFEPFEAIPSSVKVTTFQSEALNLLEGRNALQTYVDGVAAARHQVRIDRVFRFDEIVEAHRYMEANQATGKRVVVVD